MSRVAIVDSGGANLASVRSAFDGLGCAVSIARRPREVEGATHLVLPGVGAFKPAIRALRESGLDRAILRSAAAGTPLLAICLGLQLLTEGSDEAPGEAGLGLISGRCERLPDDRRVPHLGWNGVMTDNGDPLLTTGNAAFANSYCLRAAPPGWRAAWTRHGVRFVAALARDRVLACQFHPELSGAYGRALIRRWLDSSETEGDRGPDEACSGLALRVVPCLDVRRGEVVKGVRFQHLRRSGDPATLAARYEEQGADELVVLDVAASPDNAATSLATIRAVRKVLSIPLIAGGGVRSVEDARALLNAGADKVSVNTAALAEPDLLNRLAAAFGVQCVVLAIDARRGDSDGDGDGDGRWEALVSGGRQATGRDAVDWAREGAARGAGEILLTSWDRDGTGDGCDLELLRAVSNAVPVPVIASGGIGTRSDFLAAARAGAAAVLAASIFHYGDDTAGGVKTSLAEKGLRVRT